VQCGVAAHGYPISVVDLDRLEAPLRVAIAPAQTSYVFNPAGQEIRLDGLLCLFDAVGAAANPAIHDVVTVTESGS
jgi:hypothetical protein